MSGKRWAVLLIILAVALVAPSVLAASPTGSGPDDPLFTTGNWQPIAPNSSLWFYYDYPGDKSKVEVDLDTNGTPNVSLSIFTQTQADARKSDPTTKPVGIGTPPGSNSASFNHDLVWLGGFIVGGRYYAVVTNRNSGAVPFRLTISGSNVITAPTPLPTPTLNLPNPFATPVPSAAAQGRILFLDGSGGVAYLVNGDGSNLKGIVSGVLDPSLSPDGKKITYTRWSDPAGVYIANVDGTNEQIVFGGQQILSPQWSPNGSQILFTRPKGGSSDSQFCFRGQCFSFLGDQRWKLGLWNLNTGTLSEPRCSNHCFSPTWNKDGQTIAYADAAYGIMKTDILGGSESNLLSQNPDVQSSKWSPDGSKIVFQVRQHDHWEINIMSADGSIVYPVTFADPLSFSLVSNVAPTWSPDGKKILFLSDRGGKWQFYTVNADGTQLSQVLKRITDGMTIYYASMSERMVEWLP